MRKRLFSCKFSLLFLWATLSLVASFGVQSSEDQTELWLWSEDHREQWENMFSQIENLKTRHSQNPISGIEVLIAEPGDARIQSQFGHAMVRFISSTSDTHPGGDLVLNFVAYVHTPRLSARGGLSGEYAIIPEVMTLSQAMSKYLQTEGRPLRRIFIPSSQQMREDLLENLFGWWSELEQARPRFLEQAKEKTKKDLLKQARELNPSADFLAVTLPSPQGGDLGVTLLADQDLPQMDIDQWQALKELDESDDQLLELVNRQAFHQTFNKMKDQAKANQWLLKVGPHLALLEPLKDFHLSAISLETTEYRKTIMQATLDLRAKGYQILSIRDLTIAEVYQGVQRDQKSLVIFPFELWQKAVLEQKVESKLIAPDFTPIRPPRMTVEDLGRYTFLGQNCASALIRYFEAAELPARPGRSVARRVPTKLSEFLNESLLAPYPELKIERLALLKEKLVAILRTENFQNYALTKMSEKQKQQILSVLKSHPLASLFYLIPDLNEEDRQYFLSQTQNEDNSFARVHGLQQVPASLYQTCEDKRCAQKTSEDLEKVFSKQAIKDAKKQMRLNTRQQLSPRDYSRIDRRRTITPAPVYYKRAEVIKHLDLMDFLNARFPRAL